MRTIWPTGRGVFHVFLLTFVLIAASTTMTAQAGFTISATPSSLSIPQNGQGVSIITTSISGGFNADIDLSASGMPTGVDGGLQPADDSCAGLRQLDHDHHGRQQHARGNVSHHRDRQRRRHPAKHHRHPDGDGAGSGQQSFGFDFRNTKTFVSDPSGSTYVLPTTAYPTKGNGVTYGWVKTSLVQGRDRNAKVDPRLAGVNFATNGSPATFYVDLPSPGTYNLSLALGDAGCQAMLGAVPDSVSGWQHGAGDGDRRSQPTWAISTMRRETTGRPRRGRPATSASR